MTTIYDPIHGRELLPGNVIPEVFGEAISYEDKIIALLKWILNQGYITTAQYDELVKQIESLRNEFDEFKTSGFEDYYEQSLREWINRNFADILTEGIKSVVFFGLTLDGYFTAYIPQSWSDIIFDTGAVYGSEEYGRLILYYPSASPDDHATLQPSIPQPGDPTDSEELASLKKKVARIENTCYEPIIDKEQ